MIVRVLAPVAVAAALLAGCGGGTTQVSSFVPARLIVLGDENSVIENDGSNDGYRYTINDRRSTVAGKCLLLPTFSQAIAGLYGFVFAQCNSGTAAPKAFIHAVVNAKVDDASTGLSQQLAGVSGLGASDLVSVMIGANDIIEIYERVQAATLTADAAVAEAQRRGNHAAAQVNAVLATGARAIVVTVPDMGLSPYAVNANKSNPGASSLLSQLTFQYNAYLRTRIDATSYDGRNYGLVLADEVVAAINRVPTAFLLAPANTTEAACTTASVKDCKLELDPSDSTKTISTLVTGAGTSTHLWASDRHLGPEAHSLIGQQAQSRLVNNPF